MLPLDCMVALWETQAVSVVQLECLHSSSVVLVGTEAHVEGVLREARAEVCPGVLRANHDLLGGVPAAGQ